MAQLTRWGAAMLAFFLAGCLAPTPFKPAETRGSDGYTVERLEPDRFRIGFAGNEATSPRQVADSLAYLASQVTLRNDASRSARARPHPTIRPRMMLGKSPIRLARAPSAAAASASIEKRRRKSNAHSACLVRPDGSGRRMALLFRPPQTWRRTYRRVPVA